LTPLKLPADAESERWLIGACTYTPLNAAIAVDAGLGPDDFWHATHARQFSRLYACYLAGEDPDPGLTQDGVGGPAYDAPQISDPLAYVAVTLDCAERRRSILEALGRPAPRRSWEEWAAAK
jgi:hypothetical protein